VRPLLFGLKDNFTMLELDLAISLKSKYSKRIYEILSSFRNVGSYHTTVEELKLTLGLIDPKTGVEQLTVWTKFENDVLKKAMLEINKKTELNMSYTLRKWGRKYHWIDFKFKVVPLQKTIQYETPVNEMTTALMNELNLAPYQVSQILESFDQKQIWKKIMEIRMAKNDGKIKSSVGAYSAYAFGLIKPKNYEQK
jgi:plasmid replication initiation protein